MRRRAGARREPGGAVTLLHGHFELLRRRGAEGAGRALAGPVGVAQEPPDSGVFVLGLVFRRAAAEAVGDLHVGLLSLDRGRWRPAGPYRARARPRGDRGAGAGRPRPSPRSGSEANDMLRRPRPSLLALLLALRLAHGGAARGCSRSRLRGRLRERFRGDPGPRRRAADRRERRPASPSSPSRRFAHVSSRRVSTRAGSKSPVASLNPTIEVELWGPSEEGDDETRTEASIEWDVTAALLTGRRTAAARAALEAARLRAEAALVARAFEVEGAFHALRAAKRKLAIARTRAELAAVVADTARALVDAGNAATLSALREDASRERAALALSDAELAAVEAEERLSILLGAGSVEGVREAVAAIGDEAPPLPEAAPDTSSLEGAALASSLELREVDARLRAVAARIRLAKAEGRWPDVSAPARNAREAPGGIGGGVSIGLPLVDRNQGRLLSLDSERRSLEERRRATEAAVRSAARRGSEPALPRPLPRRAHNRLDPPPAGTDHGGDAPPRQRDAGRDSRSPRRPGRRARRPVGGRRRPPRSTTSSRRAWARVWGYNGATPGPTIEAVEGDRVRIYVTNRLPEPTTVHWHGVLVPNGMDGVVGLTQAPIEPGETFRLRVHARPARARSCTTRTTTR